MRLSVAEGLVLQLEALVSSVSGSLHQGPRARTCTSNPLRLPSAPSEYVRIPARAAARSDRRSSHN